MFEIGPPMQQAMHHHHDNNNLRSQSKSNSRRPFHSSPVRTASKPPLNNNLKRDPKAKRIPQSLLRRQLSYNDLRRQHHHHQTSDNPNVIVNDSDEDDEDVVHVNTEGLHHDDMGHPTLTTYHTNFLGLQFPADEALPFTSISNLFPPIPLDDLEVELELDLGLGLCGGDDDASGPAAVLVGSCGRRRLECLDVEDEDADGDDVDGLGLGMGGDGYGWQYRNNGTTHFVSRGHIEEVTSTPTPTRTSHLGTTTGNEAVTLVNPEGFEATSTPAPPTRSKPKSRPKSIHRTSTGTMGTGTGKGLKAQSILAPSSLGLGLAFNQEPLLPASCTPPPRPKMRATSLPSLSFIGVPKSERMDDNKQATTSKPPPAASMTAGAMGATTLGQTGVTQEAMLDDSELVTTNLTLLDLARDDLESLSISLSSLASSSSSTTSSLNLESHTVLCQNIKEATNALVDALSQRWKSIRQSGAWNFRSVGWQRKHVGRMISLQTTLRRLIAIRDHPAPLTKKLKVLNRKLTEHNQKLRNLVHKIHASFDRLEMKCTHAMLVQAHADAKELRYRRQRQRQLRPSDANPTSAPRGGLGDTMTSSVPRGGHGIGVGLGAGSQIETETEYEYRIRWQEEKLRREELKRRLWNWKNTTLKRS